MIRLCKQLQTRWIVRSEVDMKVVDKCKLDVMRQALNKGRQGRQMIFLQT